MILRYARVIFPKPLGLAPWRINVIWFILFQIYQNLKKIQRVLHNPCIILLCEQFLSHWYRNTKNSSAADVISCLILKFNCFWNCKIEELLFSFESAVIYYCLTRLTAQIIKNIAFFSKSTSQHHGCKFKSMKYYCL
jgi:hypothetical protein